MNVKTRREAIKVRCDALDKRVLIQIAQDEGSDVSVIMRRLIKDYLRARAKKEADGEQQQAA